LHKIKLGELTQLKLTTGRNSKVANKTANMYVQNRSLYAS